METIPRRFVCTIVGGGLSIAILVLITLGVVEPLFASTGAAPEGGLALLIFIVMPLSLFIGSCLTGYLLKPISENRKRTIFLCSPGLYLTFPLCGYCIIFGVVTWTFHITQIVIIVIGLLWITVSFFGVLAGSALRRRKQGN